MAEVLQYPLTIRSILNRNCGHLASSHENRSCVRSLHLTVDFKSPHGKSKRKHVTIHELNMTSMVEERGSCYRFWQPRIPGAKWQLGSTGEMNKSTAIVDHEGESVCKEEESGLLIQKTDNKFVYQQKLPPWGNSATDSDTDYESEGATQSSTSSEGMVSMLEHKLFFLEERDEKILSKRILCLSRTNKVRSALELYMSMEVSGLRPSSHACNSLLSCLLRNELFDDALRVFEMIKEKQLTTSHTYSLILKAVASTHGCDSALRLFKQLVGDDTLKNGFDSIVYNTMISVCGKENNWIETEKLWRTLKENGNTGTAVTYGLLVSIFTRCGQTELALDAYHEMVQNRLKPGGDTMQAILGVCAKEGNWSVAVRVFQSMLNAGFSPNTIAYNTLINTLGKAGETELALKVYNLMRSAGHVPDAYTWNALLRALHRGNQHFNALKLFEIIQIENSSQLNYHLYNTALMSCQRLRLWDRSLQLLWQMETNGLPISTASYNLVLGACETARKPKVALQIYEHMLNQKCIPDTFTHLTLIRTCIWGSLWDEVEEILSHITPNISLYNAAIQGMCLRGKITYAKKLYTRMRESGLRPDGKTRALMLQNLRKDSDRQSNRLGRQKT